MKQPYYFLSFLLFLTACNYESRQPVRGIKNLKTGFYFLTDSLNGIKMHREHSDEVFFLEKTPFASVDNIVENNLLEIKEITHLY